MSETATSRRRTHALLRSSEIRFRRLFETAQDGILILNAETGSITDANPFLAALMGYAPRELLGKKLWELGPLQDIKKSKSAFHVLQSSAYVRYEHLPLEAKDGRRLDVEFVSNRYRVGGAHVIQCNIRDIAKRRRAERTQQKVRDTLAHRAERMERLTLLDPLTELLNRRGLQRVLLQELHRARRERAPLCALLADVDDFKQINDRFGLTAGDRTLVQIARQLTTSTRATDHVARIGGDEFLILLPGTREAEGMRIAEKLRLAIASLPMAGDLTPGMTVTASLGLVQVSDATTSIEELLFQSQATLHESKQAGKNHLSSNQNGSAIRVRQSLGGAAP